MEDCASVIPEGHCGYMYAFVFDGHSGGAASAWLNDTMYSVISKVLTEGSDDEAESSAEGLVCPLDFQETLATTFLQTDQELLGHLNGHPNEEERSAGSTATVGLVRSDKIIVANVGDSRAVLCRKGRAMDLTKEHRVYGRSGAVKSETERIEAGGGWVANGRVCDVLAVSRSFGDRNFKGQGLKRLMEYGIEQEFWDREFAQKQKFTADPIIADPDVVKVALRPEDDEFLIIASDGLWDVFSSEEAVSLARKQMLKGADASTVADKLVNWAIKRYTADNVSVVVVDLGLGAKVRAKQQAGGKSKGGGSGGLFGGLFGR